MSYKEYSTDIMATLTQERQSYTAEQDIAALLESNELVQNRLREAVLAREERRMFEESALVLTADPNSLSATELTAPYRRFAEERDETRANALWDIFGKVYEYRNDMQVLENLSDFGYRLTQQRTKELRAVLPDEYKAHASKLIAQGKELLAPYEKSHVQETSRTPALRDDSESVNAMIEEAVSFLHNTATAPTPSAHTAKPADKRLHDSISASIQAVASKLTTQELRSWATQIGALMEPVVDGDPVAYDFYPQNNDAPDVNAVIVAKVEQFVGKLAEKVEQQDPRKLVAVMAAVVALGSSVPSMIDTHHTVTPHVATLTDVEHKAASAVLNIASTQNAVVHLGAAARHSLESTATGKAVLPETALTTAAEVSKAADSLDAPVTIESITTIPSASHKPAAPVLDVHADATKVPQLFDQLSNEHPSTLLVAPHDVPSGATELLNGQPVSASVAESIVGNDPTDIKVDIDPAHPTIIPPTLEVTPSTTAPEKPAAVPSSNNHSAHPESVYQGEYTRSSDVLTNTDLDEKQLDVALQSLYGEPMARLAPGLFAMQTKYGINAVFAAAHAKVESAAGTSFFAHTRNNYFGLGAYDSNPNAAFTFSDPAQCMDYYGKLLYDNYLFPGQPYYSGGTTIHNIFVHYSSSHDQEADAIASIMNEIEATAHREAPAPTTTTTVAPTTTIPTTTTTVALPSEAAPALPSTTNQDTQWLDSWASQQAVTPPATVPPSTTPDTVAPVVTTTTTPAAPAVVWPFPTRSAEQIFPTNTRSHLDQGLDIQTDPGAPVVAIANGTISVGNPNPGGFGNDYPELTLDQSLGGPSNTVYYGHTHVAPSVIGQHVVAGEIIGYTNSGSDPSQMVTQNGSYAFPGWDEIGWAKDGTDAPVDSGAGATSAGQAMYNLLENAQPASVITPPPAS